MPIAVSTASLTGDIYINFNLPALLNYSQWNLYDQKEESFLFLTSVNIMCKTSLIMEK